MIKFSKMQALGNDFVVIDAVNQSVSLTPEQVQLMACRRFGIGCDQILLVEPASDPGADFFYRIFNADGSEAEQCGNGARCLARFIAENQLSDKTLLTLQTRCGLMHTELIRLDHVRVDLGLPEFLPSKVPFIAPELARHYEFSIADHPMDLGVVSVGNPHAVMHVKDVDCAPVIQWGPLLETHPRFPNKTNVEFMEIITPQKIKLRVWERGVGETPACGSGACAAAIIGRTWELLDANVEICLPGGTLFVEYQGADHHVYLTGSAEQIFTGIFP